MGENPKRFILCLTAICLLALPFRLAGIEWGLPDSTHLWPYHPDECLPLIALSRMDPGRGEFNPRIAEGKHTYVYFMGACLLAGKIVGALEIPRSQDYYREHPGALRRIYLWMRAVSLLSDIIGLLAVATVARVLFGDSAALWAAAFAAVDPFRVYTAHLVTYYAPAMALSSISTLGFLLQDRYRRAAWGGAVAAGLGMGMNYLAAAPLLLGIMIALREKSIRRAVLIVLMALLVFFATSPYMLIQFGTFLWGIGNLVRIYVSGTSAAVASSAAPSGITGVLAPAMGWAFLATGLAGLAWSLVRGDTRARLFAAYGMIVLAALALLKPTLARHFVIVYPILAVGAGALAARTATYRPGRIAGAAVLVATALIAAAHAASFAGTDPRDQARDWIAENIPRGSRIAGINWYFAPHISVKDYEVRMLWGEYPDRLATTPHDFLMLSDCEADLDQRDADTGYVRRTSFSGARPVWTRYFLGEKDPADLRYTRPVIVIYERVRS